MRRVAGVGEGIRTLGARRECEPRVCDYGEEGDPCKAEQRNYSCEVVSRFDIGKHAQTYVGSAHRMPRPSASGIAAIWEVFLSCPSEEWAQPEEKAPAREVVVEGKVTEA